MKTLYMITKSPHMRAEAALPFRIADPDDGILLIQNGVVMCKSIPSDIEEFVADAKDRGVTMYVCKEDLEARGFTSECNIISYDEIVDLIDKYERIV